jgi:hypothetical protein
MDVTQDGLFVAQASAGLIEVVLGGRPLLVEGLPGGGIRVKTIQPAGEFTNSVSRLIPAVSLVVEEVNAIADGGPRVVGNQLKSAGGAGTLTKRDDEVVWVGAPHVGRGGRRQGDGRVRTDGGSGSRGRGGGRRGVSKAGGVGMVQVMEEGLVVGDGPIGWGRPGGGGCEEGEEGEGLENCIMGKAMKILENAEDHIWVVAGPKEGVSLADGDVQEGAAIRGEAATATEAFEGRPLFFEGLLRGEAMVLDGNACLVYEGNRVH